MYECEMPEWSSWNGYLFQCRPDAFQSMQLLQEALQLESRHPPHAVPQPIQRASRKEAEEVDGTPARNDKSFQAIINIWQASAQSCQAQYNVAVSELGRCSIVDSCLATSRELSRGYLWPRRRMGP